MARLNEPVLPVESIDSLKRRFLRQNRDIARVNQTQSVRIRNLEIETSRLLSENLCLREENLRLQGELEDGKGSAGNIGLIKSQLETKLLELGALITGIGEDDKGRTSSLREKRTPKSSPKRAVKRPSHPIEIDGQDGRLPIIQENKSYPRKSLETQEILRRISDVASDATGSPEMGSPPVSQFISVDPVKLDLPVRSRGTDRNEVADLDPLPTANLERRRKPKDKVVSEVERGAREESKSRESAGGLKIGAKRKLSVRDDSETETTTQSATDEDVKISRRNSENVPRSKGINTENKAARNVMASKAAIRDKPSTASGNAPILATRKILATKSVNNSPRKGQPLRGPEDGKPAKPEILKKNTVGGFPARAKVQQVPAVSEASSVEKVTEVVLEPETPAGLTNIFSPSSQPSTARAESRDTPPPADLGQEADGKRVSRRARGSVSYAEPNLRDKMRRPTKELVDAVTTDGNRRSMASRQEDGDAPLTAVKIKSEPAAEEDWKRLPTMPSEALQKSPLSGKTVVVDSLPSNIAAHRRRRESILHQAEIDAELSKNGPERTLSGLLAAKRKAKAEANDNSNSCELGDGVTGSEKEGRNLHLFRAPSPPPISPDPKKGAKRAGRPPYRNAPITHDVGDDSEASDLEATIKVAGSTSRRRQSTLGFDTSALEPMSDSSRAAVDRSSSAAGSSETESTGVRGSGRVAARRRSMMI